MVINIAINGGNDNVTETCRLMIRAMKLDKKQDFSLKVGYDLNLPVLGITQNQAITYTNV